MPKKLLLADDSVTIQKVISITFASDDYELIVVGDGDSAVAKAKESAPDIILADVAMPGKNGYEVCEAIKTDAALCRIPVMLLAGTFEPLDSDEATRVKADDSIVKPFESQELIDKVNSLLANTLSTDIEPSAESSFEVPDEDFGADSIPGIEEAGSDLDFLEGGIFEEATAKSDATAHAPFVDLEVTDEELTPADSSPDVFDISAATATQESEKKNDELSIGDISESGEAFSFEPEAASLEVNEAELAGGSVEPFELEHFGADTGQASDGIELEDAVASTEEPFEVEHLGADAASFRDEPAPFNPAAGADTDSVLIGSPDEAVDFGSSEFELDSGTPAPGEISDIEEHTAAPEVDAVTEAETAPEIVEEIVQEAVAEPAPELIEEPVAAPGAEMAPEIVEEIVQEAVAEPAPELIEEPVAAPGAETPREVIEEPFLEEAEVSEELIGSLDDDFIPEADTVGDTAEPELLAEPEPAVEEAVLEEEPEPAELYEAALEELEPETPSATGTVEPVKSTEPVGGVAEAAIETVVEQSVDAVAAATAAVTGSLPKEKVEEIVAGVAREIIEKVAWEVVPELAEELINAEIKKFKTVMMQTK